MPATVLAPVAEPRRLLPPESILPPVIARPAANLWLWVLPIAILLGLNAEAYWVVEGNMTDAQRHLAWWLGAAAVANMAAGVVMFGVTRQRCADATPVAAARWWWGLPAVAVNVVYLWLTIWATDQVLPENVRAWIYPPDRFMFNQLSFAMLPLFFGVVQIACMAPAKQFGSAFGSSVGLAIGAPMGMFVALEIISTIGNWTGAAIVFATMLIATSLAMFIGVIRCVMLLMRAAQGWGRTMERLLVVAIALALPTAGLLLNRSIPFPVDYQAWEVYALTLTNAAILLLSAWKQAVWPRASFNLLCVTLPFTLYFFVVLLPYTPLAIAAVMFFGLGFLILTPTLLLALHLYLLTRAARALPSRGLERTRAIATATACFLLLPGLFVGRALADKSALNSALDFVTAPSVQTGDMRYPGDPVNLRRALASHRHYKNGIYYPLLSDFYSWLVFDNLVLPDPILTRLEQTFIGTAGSKTNHDPLRTPVGVFFLDHRSVRSRTMAPRAGAAPQTVEIATMATRVTPKMPDAVLTVTLTLRNTGSMPAEFRETLPLPAGVFVSGFRLQVGDALVPGRIFEKKTAQWVYTMIRDTEWRRDPGLLVYTHPEELQLSVYPVNPHETKKVEIDFLLPQTIAADALLRHETDPARLLAVIRPLLTPHLMMDREGAFLSGGALALPAVQRPTYLHVIVDRSEANGFTGDVGEALRRLAVRFPDAHDVRLTLANYDMVDVLPSRTPIGSIGVIASAGLDRQLPLRGGFALDLALAHALRQHRDADLDFAHRDGIPARPIFVILSRKAERRTLATPLAEPWAEIGGGLEIHELDPGMTQVTQRSSDGKTALLRLGNSIRPLLPNAGVHFAAAPAGTRVEYWSPDLGAWRDLTSVDVQDASTAWGKAASLAREQHENVCDPGAGRAKFAGLVHRSRETGVLLPSTSYIVAENQAQWRTLELGEQQKLGQNSALEFHEAPAPSFWLLGSGFALWAWARKRLRKRNASTTQLGQLVDLDHAFARSIADAG